MPIGDIFTSVTDTIGSFFYTNQEQADNAVALAQAEAQLAAANNYDPFPPSTTSTTTILLIVGAVVALGVLVYFLTRKK